MESSGPGVQVHQAIRLPGLDGVARSDLVVEEGKPSGPPSALTLQKAFGPLGQADAVAAGPLLVVHPEEVPVRDGTVLVGGGVLGRPRAVGRRARDIV